VKRELKVLEIVKSEAIGSSTCQLLTHSLVECWCGAIEWSIAIIVVLYPGILRVEHFSSLMSQYQ
jgi:hypothetical protein